MTSGNDNEKTAMHSIKQIKSRKEQDGLMLKNAQWADTAMGKHPQYRERDPRGPPTMQRVRASGNTAKRELRGNLINRGQQLRGQGKDQEMTGVPKAARR